MRPDKSGQTDKHNWAELNRQLTIWVNRVNQISRQANKEAK